MLVVRHLPANVLAVGKPCRVIRQLSRANLAPLLPAKIRGHEACKAARPRNFVVSMPERKHATARSLASSMT